MGRIHDFLNESNLNSSISLVEYTCVLNYDCDFMIEDLNVVSNEIQRY